MLQMHYASIDRNVAKALIAVPVTSKAVTMSMVCAEDHSTTFDKTCRVKDHLQTVKLGCPIRII